MNQYDVRFFNTVNWEWNTCEVIAENEEQVRKHVDGMASPAIREKNGEATLDITIDKEVTIPLVIDHLYSRG